MTTRVPLSVEAKSHNFAALVEKIMVLDEVLYAQRNNSTVQYPCSPLRPLVAPLN